jgi:hypothetical protein
MQTQPEQIDDSMSAALTALSATRNDYWSFNGNAKRSFCHNYFQYPAMMVPEMLGDLMTIVAETDPNIETVFDPFAGSGTVLTETMLLGRAFTGFDINPLAILLCEAKSGPFRYEYLSVIAGEVREWMRNDKSTRIETNLSNRNKWFQYEISIELSRIRRAIRKVPELWCRRFLWVALAETVRLSSNSRTSTFKLHIRPQSEISARHLEPQAIFWDVVSRNLNLLSEFRDALEERHLLSHGCYLGHIKARLKSASSRRGPEPNKSDLMVTSPPYGDNATTVPYGQHSYLPLNWIDLHDILPSIDSSCLKTTHEIDRRSLGGSRKDALKLAESAIDRSQTFKSFLDALKDEPVDRTTRAASFIRDLDGCIDPILRGLRRNAYMIWVIGNRRIAGQQMKTHKILGELLLARKAHEVCSLTRRIPTKRMAVKNNITATMNKEAILVFRNAGGN